MKPKPTDVQARQIRSAKKHHKFSDAELGRRFGFPVRIIARVLTGQLCPDAGGPIIPRRPHGGRGEKNARAVLSDATVEEMRIRYAQGGISYDEIGGLYGVNKSTARKAITGKSHPNAGGPIAPSRRGSLRGKDHLRAHRGMSNAKVFKMRVRFAAREVTESQLAREHRVTPQCIYAILTGKTWREAGGPIAKPRPFPMRGEAHPTAQVSLAKVAEICRAYAERGSGEGYGSVAKQHGVSKATVRNYVLDRSWRHVGGLARKEVVEPTPAVVKLEEGVYRVSDETLTIPPRARSQRRLVDALILAGRPGLSVGAMQAKCPGYWKVLNELRRPGSPWERAILPPDPEERGKRDSHWRIAYVQPPRRTHQLSIMSGS